MVLGSRPPPTGERPRPHWKLVALKSAVRKNVSTFLTRSMKGALRNMKKSPVICDSCGNEFKIKKILKKKHRDGLEGNLTISYFVCPKCKKKYVSFVENEKLRKMIQERKTIYSGIRNLKDPEDVEDVFKKVDDLDWRIKSRTNHLKFHFSKYV